MIIMKIKKKTLVLSAFVLAIILINGKAAKVNAVSQLTYFNIHPMKYSEKEHSFFDDNWEDDCKNLGDGFTNNDNLKEKLINTKEWNISDISEIRADYRHDSITVLPCKTKKIVLKEYLTENAPQYHAHTSLTDTILKIKNGERPTLRNYLSRIEIYIPVDFHGIINVNTNLGSLNIKSITVPKLILKTNNGSINVTNSNGKLNCKANLGSINIKGGTVGGTLVTKNGSIELNPDKIKRNIQVTSNLGSIKAILPKDFSFTITATSKMGDIINKFTDTWKVIGDDFTQMLHGTWGTKPIATISLFANMGQVEILAK